ncbi:MAG: class I SAM-dependent methyltransferase [Chloroflexi bacterium]|nr:class I SAM-dependent methyltransferase [Chloroflexota bacterium]
MLDAAAFSETGVRQALALEGTTTLQPGNEPVSLRPLAEGGQLATLIKLFLLGVAVDATEAARWLQPLELDRLEAMGLLERAPKGVRSPVQLFPYRGVVLASDRYKAGAPGADPYFVLPVNPTSITLDSLTIREPVQWALDLGTGCGVQAILAAKHSQRVMATDINPRALNFTSFNALLNGTPAVETRLGSLFDPAQGCQFDLVVSNPPYVVSPDSRYVFRDGGLPGDALCADVVSKAPAFLRPGGFAHILCNWVHRRDEDWSAPLRRWVAETGCDALLLHYQTEDPFTYAAKWVQPLHLGNEAAYARTLDRWVDYYRRLGIEAISSGAVLLRRRAEGATWVRAVELPPGAIGEAGSHILRIFRAEDYLSGLDDDRKLLSEAFQLAADHRLEQTLTWQDGRYLVRDTVLALDRGIQFRGKLDPLGLHLLSQCDGTRLLDGILDEVAVTAGMARPELEAASLSVVRKLFALGFLIRIER